MNKLAIIIDTFSARTEKWCQDNNHFYFLPLQVEVDGTSHKCGTVKDIPSEDHSALLEKAKILKTSMPTPSDTVETFKKLSTTYEHVIYLSIGSAVSGTSKAATVFAKEFENVHVLNNLLVGIQFELLGKKLLALANDNKPFAEILKFANNYIDTHKETYIVPKDVTALIKSGRLGRALGMLLNRVKAVPAVAYDNFEQLSKKMLKRSWKKTLNYAIEKIVNKFDANNKDLAILITHGPDLDLKNHAVAELAKLNITPIVEKASPLTMVNTGVGAISISVIKKI